MAVAFDAKGTADQFTSNPASPKTFTGQTVGSGSNRALIALVLSDVTLGTVSAHWDSTGTNQAMTLIAVLNASTAGFLYLYGLVAPTSGNKTLSISFTGTPSDLYVDTISFTGVDQTGGSTTFYNSNTNTGTTGTTTLTVTSAVTDAAVCLGSIMDTSIGFLATNQTQIFLDNNVSSVQVAGAAAYNVGTASVAFSFTVTGVGAAWGMNGVAIKAAGSSVPVASFLGTGLLNANAQVTNFTGSNFLGTGLLNSTAILTVFNAAHFNGSGALNAGSFLANFAGATFAGAGLLNTEALIFNFPGALFAGTGALKASSQNYVFGNANFLGAGALNANANSYVFGTGLFLGSGSLLANGLVYNTGNALFAGVGLLNVGLNPLIPVGAFLSGSGLLNTSALNLNFAGADFLGSGLLNASLAKLVPPPFGPRRPTGKVLTLDVVQGYVLGNYPVINESCALIVYLGPGFPPNNAALLVFTLPDGTLQVADRTYAFVGDVPIAQTMLPNFPAEQYVAYTFAIGELYQVGRWFVTVAVGNFASNPIPFQVVRRPV